MTLFYSIDVAMAAAALPKIFEHLSQLWLSEKSEVMTSATHALEVLLKDAFTSICATKDSVEQHKSKVAKCINVIRSGLGYQYNAVWHQVLHVISVLFEVSESCFSSVIK